MRLLEITFKEGWRIEEYFCSLLLHKSIKRYVLLSAVSCTFLKAIFWMGPFIVHLLFR